MAIQKVSFEYVRNGGLVTNVIMSATDDIFGPLAVELTNADVSLVLNGSGDLANVATVKSKLLEKFDALIASLKTAKTDQATKDAADAAAKAKISLSVTKAELDTIVTKEPVAGGK